MKIVAEIHGYPPHHNSGAEWMIHDMFKYLLKQGHEIRILLKFDTYLGFVAEPYEFQGIKIESDKDYENHYLWADIIFTHLDKTGKAYNRARQFNKPLVHLIHNHYNNSPVESLDQVRQYCVYNTKWIQKELVESGRHDKIKGGIVVRPPVFIKDYRTETKINNYISLINVNKNKGGETFKKVAERLPDRKFLGVMGSYGAQIVDNSVKNIHYVYNAPDIRNIYKRTRILLMPSLYESYGRTAIEAAANGIPVICSPTIGLKEALGDAAIYVERDNISGYIEAIKFLDNEKNYKAQSKKIFSRAEKMDPTNELDKLTKFLLTL
jgi:glycosyltransferase involved in cell wall biosynthesis